MAIYRSNLTAPDLQPHFAATTVCYPRHWSMGHDVLSDKDFDPDCTFMLHDEAAILYQVACRTGGLALDIGSRMGWTACHIAAAGLPVTAVDPAYVHNKELTTFGLRALENIASCSCGLARTGHDLERIDLWGGTSDQFFNATNGVKFGLKFGLIVIDGNHDAPHPACDAMNAAMRLNETGVIVFHDFWGKPIRDGVEHLIGQGFSCRAYDTPAGMAVCWRGDFTPPDHTPDPAIDWGAVRSGRAAEFDFSRCI